jgi:hypothetical protein
VAGVLVPKQDWVRRRFGGYGPYWHRLLRGLDVGGGPAGGS